MNLTNSINALNTIATLKNVVSNDDFGAQGDLVRKLKAEGAPEVDVKKEVQELKARKKVFSLDVSLIFHCYLVSLEFFVILESTV